MTPRSARLLRDAETALSPSRHFTLHEEKGVWYFSPKPFRHGFLTTTCGYAMVREVRKVARAAGERSRSLIWC